MDIKTVIAMKIKRKPAHKTSFKYRCYSVTSLEVKRKSTFRKILFALGLKYRLLSENDVLNVECNTLKLAIVYLLTKYQKLCFASVPNVRHRKKCRISKTFQAFSDDDCWKKFRTRKEDLPKLLKAFQMNDIPVFVADNGMTFTNQEVLMIGLNRFVTPGQLENIMKAEFNLDYTSLSRAVKLFVSHLLDNCSTLLTDNLDFWSEQLPYFAEKIEATLAFESNLHFAPGSFRVAGFHDCTVIASCRPGGGPTVDGERYDNFIQMAYYNGWKKHHGIKYQTLEFPNGLAGDMFGPRSFRRSDVELLNDSELNARLAAVQVDAEKQCVSYGDGVYPIGTHTIGKHTGNITPRQIAL